jgi:hypothetical protein
MRWLVDLGPATGTSGAGTIKDREIVRHLEPEQTLTTARNAALHSSVEQVIPSTN